MSGKEELVKLENILGYSPYKMISVQDMENKERVVFYRYRHLLQNITLNFMVDDNYGKDEIVKLQTEWEDEGIVKITQIEYHTRFHGYKLGLQKPTIRVFGSILATHYYKTKEIIKADCLYVNTFCFHHFVTGFIWAAPQFKEGIPLLLALTSKYTGEDIEDILSFWTDLTYQLKSVEHRHNRTLLLNLRKNKIQTD